MNKNTYWENKGKYQKLANKLHKLIPYSGPVNSPKANKHLETYRIACGAYYDLFNNGLCNRAPEFRKAFGFGGKFIVKQKFPYCAMLEKKMDEIILAAAKEQRIK